MRKAMALLIFAVISMFSCAEASAQYNRGDKAFGVRGGFESRNTSAVAGASFEYTLSRHLRLAPEFDIIFRNKNMDGGSFSFTVDFPLQLAGDRAAFYPMAGLSYRSWGIHNKDYETMKDVTTRRNSFALNLGCGAEMLVSQTCKISLEAVYGLQRHFPGVQILAGVSFVF